MQRSEDTNKLFDKIMMMHPQLPKQQHTTKDASSSRNVSVLTILTIGFVLISSLIGFSIYQSQKSSSVRTMEQPKIGGTEALHQGPWPECLNMTSTNCINHIETYAEDLRQSHYFQIIPPDTFVTMDFISNRVRIHVNESNIVIQIPKRG